MVTFLIPRIAAHDQMGHRLRALPERLAYLTPCDDLMRDFGSCIAAARFYSTHDERHDPVRYR